MEFTLVPHPPVCSRLRGVQPRQGSHPFLFFFFSHPSPLQGLLIAPADAALMFPPLLPAAERCVLPI